MKNLVFLIFIMGTIQADFWEETKTKGLEYYKTAKGYDKEYNITNQVKKKGLEYYNKTKAYDKEKNISNSVKKKASNGWRSFKSLF